MKQRWLRIKKNQINNLFSLGISELLQSRKFLLQLLISFKNVIISFIELFQNNFLILILLLQKDNQTKRYELWFSETIKCSIKHF